MTRFFLALALVFSLSSAHAGKALDFKQIGVTNTGSKATIGMSGPSAPYASAVPVTPPTNMSGWQPAGNYGAATSATGPTMTLNTNGEVIFPGVKYPFQAGFSSPVSTLVDSVKALSGGPLGLAVFALPFVIDWLVSSGGRVNPATGQLERSQDSSLYNGGAYSDCQQLSFTLALRCNITHVYVTTPDKLDNCVRIGTSLVGTCRYIPNGTNLSGNVSLSVLQTDWLPSSMDDIAPYMSARAPDARAVQTLLDNGADINPGNPTITGPSSVVGPSTTTNNPDGSRTVTNTTYNFSTAGNTVTNTSNVTTSTTYNTDNSVRSVSTTTEAPKEQDNAKAVDQAMPDQPTLYKRKYPDGLTGVWTAQKTALMATPLLQLTSSMNPTIVGSGGYPSFPIAVVVGPWNFGSYDASPPGFVWDFLKVCVIVTALFLARALIFGG